MSKLARQLLVKWIMQVMYMMCSNYVAYSAEWREELAGMTADLKEAIERS